jgi:hypothetical protein
MSEGFIHGRPRTFEGERFKRNLKELIQSYYQARSEPMKIKLQAAQPLYRKGGTGGSVHSGPVIPKIGDRIVKAAWGKKPDGKHYFIAADVLLAKSPQDDKLLELFEATLSIRSKGVQAHFSDVKRIIL